MAKKYLALDVGERRIGVALANSDVKIAVPGDYITVDGTEFDVIRGILAYESIDVLVVGYPRNQQGEPTAQTQYVENFVSKLGKVESKIVFQDESLTSVKAESILAAQKRPYAKGDIDSMAASVILQDYLEMQHGRL
jgi:RNAse H domain protein, YqgF family